MGAGMNISAAIGGGLLVCLVAAAVGIYIGDYTATPCECLIAAVKPPPGCESLVPSPPACGCPNATEPPPPGCECPPARCQLIALYMKVPLIAVHMIPFILMPVSMWVCEKRAGALQQRGMKSPAQVVLGLAYIMVSISGEVGWHVHQNWFYHEDYDILNFFFYAFITLGTSFWALGAQTDDTKSTLLDALLLLCTPLTTLTYAWGAHTASYDPLAATKVPIYLIMSYQFILLTWRLFKLLNNDFKVWLFPFFSIGVNLFFVFLLQKYETHLILNPLFHMLHDAAGTEMGILIITLILWHDTSTDYSKKSS